MKNSSIKERAEFWKHFIEIKYLPNTANEAERTLILIAMELLSNVNAGNNFDEDPSAEALYDTARVCISNYHSLTRFRY